MIIPENRGNKKTLQLSLEGTFFYQDHSWAKKVPEVVIKVFFSSALWVLRMLF